MSAVSLALGDLIIDDANIIFFVRGYIDRSISRRRKCSVYRELLVDGNKFCNIDDSIPVENKQLFLQVEKGGVYAPTEFTYAVTALSVRFYTAIYTNTTVKRKLFASSNQWADFTLVTTNVLKAEGTRSCKTCASGQSLHLAALQKMQSCIAGLQ